MAFRKIIYKAKQPTAIPTEPEQAHECKWSGPISPGTTPKS